MSVKTKVISLFIASEANAFSMKGNATSCKPALFSRILPYNCLANVST